MIRLSACQIVGIVFVFTQLSIAADPPARITKEYDLSNLLIVVPDFTDAPAFNQPGDAVKAEPAPPATQPDADEAAKHDAELVTSWATSLARADEPFIDIKRTENKFAVTATSQQHERLERQVAVLRVQRQTQIRVETRFLYLGRTSEAALPPAVAEKLELVRIPGGASAGMQIDEAAATAIIDAIPNDRDSSTLSAPGITLFNGQRAYALVATQRSATTGYTKNVDTNEWDPKVEVFQSGLLLDVRCRADDSGKIVAVNLKPELTRLLDLREEPFKDAPADANLKVQNPKMDVRKLDALVSMSAGSTMLFYIPSDPTIVDDDRRLYVLLKATVNRP